MTKYISGTRLSSTWSTVIKFHNTVGVTLHYVNKSKISMDCLLFLRWLNTFYRKLQPSPCTYGEYILSNPLSVCVLTTNSFLSFLAASWSRESDNGIDNNSSFSDSHSPIGETLSLHLASLRCLSFSKVVNFIDKLKKFAMAQNLALYVTYPESWLDPIVRRLSLRLTKTGGHLKILVLPSRTTVMQVRITKYRIRIGVTST